MARDHRSEAGDAEAREPRRVESRGPGPFTTHQLYPLDGGGHQVANSRRHRKRLAPHRVLDVSLVDRPVPVRPSAFRHFWAPGRLAWWIAIVFAVGSGLFTLGGVAAAWPQWVSVSLREASVLNGIFIVGALFFTCGGALQWVEAINGDVAEAFGEGERRPWRWLGWRPRNLGYLASTVQLVGTLMFNVNTIAASFAGLSWQQQDFVVWTPNMVGCVCFLVASLLAYAEVAQGSLAVELRCVSWWVAVVNLVGSIAFQISAVYSFVSPGPVSASAMFWASVFTAFGGACFLVGSYLLIPELFDEQEVVDPPTGRRPLRSHSAAGRVAR